MPVQNAGQYPFVKHVAPILQGYRAGELPKAGRMPLVNETSGSQRFLQNK
jgi:hypothetical protein